MGRLDPRVLVSRSFILAVVIALIVPWVSFTPSLVYAADLTPRTLRLSDSVVDAIGITYELSFTIATTGLVGSISLQFCEEGPLPGTPCTQPPGFDAAGALLAIQTGVTGFNVYSGSSANEIILTRPPALVSSGTPASYTFLNMVNPSNDGALFARVFTFASSDATGLSTDLGGLVAAINPPATINAEVPPFLLFCLGESIVGTDCNTATEPFSDVGTLSPLVTGAAQTQILVATNADDGYTLWVQGGTMTSGNNALPEMNGEPSQTGVSQFGINLRANTNPIVGEDVVGPGSATIAAGYSQQNQFRFQSGDTLATTTDPDDFRKYTVSYVVNVDENQPGGVYATTLTYIALANF